jgi:hypothetical protein
MERSILERFIRKKDRGRVFLLVGMEKFIRDLLVGIKRMEEGFRFIRMAIFMLESL